MVKLGNLGPRTYHFFPPSKNGNAVAVLIIRKIQIGVEYLRVKVIELPNFA